MVLKKYQILEHKADLKIKVFGKDKKELFENAMKAMFEVANYKFQKNSPEKKLKIKISSFDFPSLLIDFLSEVLYLTETKKLVFEKIKIEKLEDKKLEAVLVGKKLKNASFQIKAVTWHDLEIKETKEGIEAQILFDI